MNNHNQDGAINGLVVSLILVVLLLIGAIVFGIWAFSGRQDYKNNVDSKIRTAVDSAVNQESQLKDSQFAQEAKLPLTTYNGPQAYGSIVLSYPKNWSGYVDTTGSDQAVDGYFQPGVVPSITNTASVFALRIQVLNQSYSQTLQNFQQQPNITSVAYALPKMPKVVGVEVTGQITGQTNETMVILPLRAQTLELWTDGNQYLSDFNQIILPNFSFSP